jgi:hypothetical protein
VKKPDFAGPNIVIQLTIEEVDNLCKLADALIDLMAGRNIKLDRFFNENDAAPGVKILCDISQDLRQLLS